MIIVTGAAGFIGSNLIRGIRTLKGFESHPPQIKKNIIAVDDLTEGTKFNNLSNYDIDDYWDKDLLLKNIEEDRINFKVDCVFHQGACTDTQERDEYYMMENNYRYSVTLFEWCQQKKIPFIYASSAAIYGSNTDLSEPKSVFNDKHNSYKPLNIYGHSKLLFDKYVSKKLSLSKKISQVVGLRYFNVYGPGESHKGNMASVIYHFNKQALKDGEIQLFKGSHGWEDGEHRRDFVYVEDVVSVNLWFLINKGVSGIYNVGTGNQWSFNEVADEIFKWHGIKPNKKYISFPEGLESTYQAYTQANIDKLKGMGYEQEFKNIEQGIKKYLDYINGPKKS
ncbi:MAG: ADP-glyceromanno-heptose 6-epimerase [Pseudomonadota bacterium]|nr:ADP-glyceromanno-heptose 6-epimerase [Pseudomonadota bacterium]